MPTYTFKNNETGEVKEIILRMSELDDYKENNPHLTIQIGAANFVYNSGNKIGVSDGFREVMSKVKERLPVHNIQDDKY